MERLTRMHCDGCDRPPSFWEWFRGELFQQGYEDWHHPGIAFKAAGLALNYENRSKGQRVWQALFGHPMPDELSYLCPSCHASAEHRLPELIAQDPGDPQTIRIETGRNDPPPVYLGRE